jgi:hypothetical protein
MNMANQSHKTIWCGVLQRKMRSLNILVKTVDILCTFNEIFHISTDITSIFLIK